MDTSVDLRGAWVANGALGVYVVNASAAIAQPECPVAACIARNGTLNVTLFPGTYEMGFWAFGGPYPGRVLTVTQSIEAVFDRGLDVLQPTGGGFSIPANGYSAWSISAPTGASNFLVAGSISTTGCNYSMAILPPQAFQAFQSDRNAISSPGAVLIYTSAWHWCAGPPALNTFTLGYPGPMNLASGDTLVFWNSSGSTAWVAAPAPIELSYLLPA